LDAIMRAGGWKHMKMPALYIRETLAELSPMAQLAASFAPTV
jgi:hypothetical protein